MNVKARLAASAIAAAFVSATLLAQTPQRPLFRAGANLVQVDTYPTRDGRFVGELRAEDFDILEDGRRQTIEFMELIRVEANTTDAERRDPQTQAEGNALAADPRNRVFIIYLDHYHVAVDGSFRTRRPLVDMLNRLIAPNDLFGVMTAQLRPTDLILGRKTLTLEEQLTRHWTWGQKQSGGQSFWLEPEEEYLAVCFDRAVADDLARRRRQAKVLDSLEALMAHLGGLREARKAILLFTSGWTTYKRRNMPGDSGAGIPQIGVDPRGRITTNAPPGMANRSQCYTEMARLYELDTDMRIRDLLTIANRNNVAYYPVNPAGLEAPDLFGDALTQTNDIRDRWNQARTLADNTDGMAVGGNDMSADLRRVADDMSQYYVLSYYSTNTRFDGRYRRIEVKVKTPGVRVKARRGYVAPKDNPEATGSAVSVLEPTPAKGPSPVDDALGVLARLRPSAELFTHGTSTGRDLLVAVEMPADRRGRWATGADVQVLVTDSSGATAGTAHGRIDPPGRGSLIRIPLTAASIGPWRVTTRVSDASETVTDQIEVSSRIGGLVGDAMLFRGRPALQAPLSAAADFQFHRGERIHLDWPVLAMLDRREARLLDRKGSPLPIPVTTTERDVDGRVTISVDLNLAPLTAGDYVIELVAAQGSDSERRLVAFRVKT